MTRLRLFLFVLDSNCFGGSGICYGGPEKCPFFFSSLFFFFFLADSFFTCSNWLAQLRIVYTVSPAMPDSLLEFLALFCRRKDFKGSLAHSFG